MASLLIKNGRMIDPASRHTLLGNTLVLVAPKDSTVSLVIEKNFPLVQALGPDGKLAMASVDTVPAGKQAASASMRKCAPSQGRPSGRLTTETWPEYSYRLSRASMPKISVTMRLAP